jgi:hypothetical protein
MMRIFPLDETTSCVTTPCIVTVLAGVLLSLTLVRHWISKEFAVSCFDESTRIDSIVTGATVPMSGFLEIGVEFVVILLSNP